MLHCIALHCIAWRRVASRRIVSYRIVSYRIVSYRIVIKPLRPCGACSISTDFVFTVSTDLLTRRGRVSKGVGHLAHV